MDVTTAVVATSMWLLAIGAMAALSEAFKRLDQR
jgi:hypothetical protein